MSRFDRFPRDWRASGDVDDRAGDESSRVEAAVKSVGKGAEMVPASVVFRLPNSALQENTIIRLERLMG